MKFKLSLVAGIALAGALGIQTAMAECDYPSPPAAAPNGATATREEMLTGMAAIKGYNAKVDEYLSCLDAESAAQIVLAGDDKNQVKQIRELAAKKHNAAIDEMQAHADEFNQQLHAFNDKHKT